MAVKKMIRTTMIPRETWVLPEEESASSQLTDLSDSLFASQEQDPAVRCSQESGNDQSSSDTDSDDYDEKKHVPRTRDALFHRFFVVEARRQYKQISSEMSEAYLPRGDRQKIRNLKEKQSWAAIMSLGQEELVTTCISFFGFFPMDEVKTMTLEQFQDQLELCMLYLKDGSLEQTVVNLKSVWGNSEVVPGLDDENGNRRKRAGTPSGGSGAMTPKRSRNKGKATSDHSVGSSAVSGTSAASNAVAPTPDRVPRGRPNEEITAQRTVKSWYGSVGIDTGHEPADAGHIFPSSIKNTQAKQDLLRSSLGCFVGAGALKKIDVELENASRNILPLSPSAHRLWDNHHLALRPIKDPTNPDTVIYLQLDFELALDALSGKRIKSSYWDRARLAHSYVINGSDCEFHALHHGDVLKLETSDPAKYPLPSFDVLQLQYALHRFVASFNAGGGYDNLFRGPPPQGPAVSQDDECASEEEEELLRFAVMDDIITEEEAELWRGGFLRYAEEERARKASKAEADILEWLQDKEDEMYYSD